MAVSSKATIRKVKNKTEDAVDNVWVERLIRLGYVMRGVLYITIGAIAIGVVLGAGSRPKDPTGALQQLSTQPYGKILLLVMALGLVGYSLWGFIRAVWDPLHRGHGAEGLVERLGFLWSSFAYGTLIFPSLQYSIGAGGGSASSTQKTQDLTARLLAMPYGQWIVGLGGLIIIAAGIGQVYYAVTAKFEKDLKPQGLSAQQKRRAVRMGQIGYAARGVVFGLVGIFLMQAAVTFDPRKAQGLDGALARLVGQPYGVVLLAVVALGLVAFGVYSLLCARWNKV